MTIRQPTPFELAAVGQAMDQGHQVSTCPDCRGARLHSRRRGIKCIRCHRYWDVSNGWAPRPKCDRCPDPLPVNRSERCLPCAKYAYRQRQSRKG